ncbi:MAG TPA: TIGR01777 family oxidoreductase [Vicinamibacterales bacterium]|nr:TIGR01777 family oxidoreductase [Vicinamibacterales bacterium]
MKVVIAGGTGFLGRPLAASLTAEGHEVVVLTRGDQPRQAQHRTITWSPDGNPTGWVGEIDGSDVVVNLAGESIAGRRWSPEQKQRILESRIRATRSLVAAVERASRRPHTFVSGSAVGFYGPHGDDIVTEETPAGSDFLADVCMQWETEARRAVSSRTRVVCIRTGLVLARDGGALSAMLLPFKIGAGGPLGSGRQYWPWIHREDWLGLIEWIVRHDQVTGAVNATGPEPVTNAVFARELGRALHRPSLIPTPAFALRLMLGEMADGLLLTGQRAVPSKADALGFSFKYRRVETALAAIFGSGPG